MFSFWKTPQPPPAYQAQAESTLIGVIRTYATTLTHAADVLEDAADYLKTKHKDTKGALALHKRAQEYRSKAAEWLD